LFYICIFFSNFWLRANKSIIYYIRSFTVPAGVTSLTVEAWGGGGKGGSQAVMVVISMVVVVALIQKC
jgi:hypothetical protein